MQLVDWLPSHAKVEDINKENFGMVLKNEGEIKEWGNDMEIRYKKTGGDLNSKALEACSKRLGVPMEYINNRVLCEAINYFISEGDNDKADILFAKAIGNGCAEAIYLLSLFHTQSGGNIEDSYQFYEQISQLPTHINLITEKGEGENKTISNNKVSESMYMTASFSFNGIGCEKNLEKSIEYYSKGAEVGNEKCLRDLGLFYLEGCGVEKNIEKALDYLKRASELGDSVSKYNYGKLLFNEQPIESFKLIQDAADLGVEDAKFFVNENKNFIEKLLATSNLLVEEELKEKSKSKKKKNNNNSKNSNNSNSDNNNNEEIVIILEKNESTTTTTAPKEEIKQKNKIIGEDCDEVD